MWAKPTSGAELADGAAPPAPGEQRAYSLLFQAPVSGGECDEPLLAILSLGLRFGFTIAEHQLSGETADWPPMTLCQMVHNGGGASFSKIQQAIDKMKKEDGIDEDKNGFTYHIA